MSTRNRLKIWTLLFCLLPGMDAYAVRDTLLIYNVTTEEMSFSPYTVDSTTTSEYTGWNSGTHPGFSELSIFPPDCTYNSSGFTEYLPAHDYYPVENYPVRTAVKIFTIHGDSLRQRCSGTLVASNYILTDCHCVSDYDSTRTLVFNERIAVAPAYDNGTINPLFGSYEAVEFITFKLNLKIPSKI